MATSIMNEHLDLSSVMRRRLAARVWVPLYLWERTTEGEYGSVGHKAGWDGAHAILVPADTRELGEQYTWSSNSDARPWSEEGPYKPADVYFHNRDIDVGIRLVLRQDTVGAKESQWHLHQDLVIALRLIREGDNWVRPEENYVEVVRLRRHADGSHAAIEIKAEYLRDYLKARDAALRIASYFERTLIESHLPDLIKEGSETQEVNGGRYEQRAYAIDSTGFPYGSDVAVFHVFRTDVHQDEDVPLMGSETGENIDGHSWKFTRGGEKRWRLSTEFWRNEWVESAEASIRVRGDHVPSQVSFIVDADGSRMSADELDDQDIGRWLWFSPAVIAGLTTRRESTLVWHTSETGSVSVPGETSVHFGLNERGLLNVYAYDVASLPEWERRYWAGHNVGPEGGLSVELHRAQVLADPADTQAPEHEFPIAIRAVRNAWRKRYTTELFREHDDAIAITRQIHRMRALDSAGLLALAKDITRLTADSIDASVAQQVAPPTKGSKPGSLKSVQQALATICGEELAHSVMGPLFAVYDLRLSDAHLPRADKSREFEILGIAEHDLPIKKGFKMIFEAVVAMKRIHAVLEEFYPGSPKFKAGR